MYVFGGYNGSSYFNDLHRLNLDTLTWSGALSPSGTPPNGRYGHTAALYGNYMYVFAGNGGSYLNDLHRTDLSTVASVFKGRPALRFDGSDDYLLCADIGTAGWGSVTIFLVFQNVTNTNAQHEAIGLYKSGSNRWGIGTDAYTTGPSYRLGWAGPDSFKGLGDYAHANLTPYVRTAIKNGSAWYSYINGAAQGTGPTDDTTSLSSNSNCSIGAEYPGSPSYYTNSDILFVAIYNRALSVSERQKVERWLGARYGITVA
jgi:hypothetical protein